MKSKQSLFKRYPLDGKITLAGETLTTPYVVYDGSMLLIGGTGNAATASEILSSEGLTPLLDDAGRALMAVWACDFADANLGPHHELQISLFASSGPVRRLKAHPFSLVRALVTEPEILMVCHGLWNNTERVVRYNSEHLGLSARLARSEIQIADDRCFFRFEDTVGSLIAEGHVTVVEKQDARVMWQITGHLGLKGMLNLMRSPYLHVPVVNTRRNSSDRNLISHTYSCHARQFVRLAGAQDRLTISHPLYARLGFAPDFLQWNDGVGFVYLRPEQLQA